MVSAPGSLRSVHSNKVVLKVLELNRFNNKVIINMNIVLYLANKFSNLQQIEDLFIAKIAR